MKQPVHLATVWLLLLLFSSFGHTAPPLRFEHLTTAHGLSSNLVTTTLQDAQGFLWVGTENGLNRFDGYEFQIHRRSAAASETLSNNHITQLFLDQSDQLWVGTARGLNRYNRSQNRFSTIPAYRDTTPDSTIALSITSLAESQERLFVGSSQGLFQFNPDKQQLAPVSAPEHIAPALLDSEVSALLFDSDGYLWVGTHEGLHQWNPVEQTLKTYRHDEQDDEQTVDKKTIIDNTIQALYEDRQGQIWIGIDGGLSRLNPETGVIRNFYHGEDGHSPELVGDEVTSILEDANGNIWIATTEGLTRYNPADETFTALIHEPQLADSLAHSKTRSLTIDRSGILWVGTQGGGISRLNLQPKAFYREQHHPELEASLGYDSVLSFHEDHAGRIWVGMEDEGFNRFDPRTGTFERFEYEAEDFTLEETTEGIFYIDSGGIHKDRVRSIQSDQRGNLWMGTSEGLEYFDVENIRFRHFHPKAGRPHSLSHENIGVLLLTSEDTMWIGTQGGGLNKFNPETYENEIFRYRENDPNALSSDRITALLQDQQGTLWIGTEGGGLNRFDAKQGNFQRFALPLKNNQAAAGSNSIWTIYQAEDHRLWVGTDEGLYQFSPDSGTFTPSPLTLNGEANRVLGIVEDDHSNLWLSKENGITKFTPSSGAVQNFNARNGLPTDQFLPGAYYRSKAGDIYLGSNQGMIHFKPHEITTNQHVPDVVLTKLEILNNAVTPASDDSPLQVDITQADRLSLSYQDKAITLTFSALDFANPENNQYAYKLEGFDPDWNFIGHRRVVSYTSLPGGHYTFKVRGSNNDQVWNEEGINLPIFVAPPPWLTWWAYTLYGLTLIAIIAGIARYRTLKIERQLVEQEKANRILEHKVADRTKELNVKNEQLFRSNQNILSSIRYAQKIQHSLLPNQSMVQQLFGDCFIVWEPFS
ncbi:MAG: hypothetical protein MI864_20070 [Pseudomonadales bacterium]|nr:hypothetical protein [Pseudomonadales bacterium]